MLEMPSRALEICFEIFFLKGVGIGAYVKVYGVDVHGYLEGFCVTYGIFGGDCGTSVLSVLIGPSPWGLCSSLHDSVWGICPIDFLGPGNSLRLWSFKLPVSTGRCPW